MVFASAQNERSNVLQPYGTFLHFPFNIENANFYMSAPYELNIRTQVCIKKIMLRSVRKLREFHSSMQAAYAMLKQSIQRIFNIIY